jgi:hypothetical protein
MSNTARIQFIDCYMHGKSPKPVGFYLCPNGSQVVFKGIGRPLWRRDLVRNSATKFGPAAVVNPTTEVEYTTKFYFKRGQRPHFYRQIEIVFFNGDELAPFVDLSRTMIVPDPDPDPAD